MSDQPSGRPADDAAQPLPAPAAKPLSDSQLRLVTDEVSDFFSDMAEPTDDSPTMISKGPPVAGPPTATALRAGSPEAILGSVRGRKLAHFELLEPIGVGGMAAVLRARDTQLDRFVALKILPPEMAADPDNVRRFRQEAQAAAKLDHENIARVFFCGEDQNLHFIAFEFVEGDNLRSILEHRGRLPVAEAVRYILQIATGLEHASSRDVVHRDVKPSNIIITPTGRAKLVDMGLARNMAPHTDQLTQSGVTLGTFDYISPEQALEPREADARSDIYSLGCTFYHMVTGQAPVPEGTAAKKLHHHQHMLPIDPRQLNPEIPDEVALVLGKMMAKNPKDRYQRPVHLVQHLMQIAEKVGAAHDLPEGVMFVDAPLLAPPRKRPLLLVSVGALALAVVLMVLSLAPPKQAGKTAPPWAGTDKPPKENGSNPVQKTASVAPPSVNVKAGKWEINSEDDLVNMLKDPGASLVGLIAKDLDISDLNLVFQGRKTRNLRLMGKVDDEGRQIVPTITWKWKKEGPAAALTIEDADAIFSNLRIRIDGDNETPEQSVGAIAVRGAGTVRFEKCSFQQVNVPALQFVRNRDRVPLASILVLPGGKSERPNLELEDCLFSHDRNLEGGQAALGIDAPADVSFKNCGFMAHAAQVHLRGEGQSKLTLYHCGAFLVNGPMFRIDDQASCDLKIDYSIFSSPEGVVSTHDPLHLIHQTDTKTPLTFGRWDYNCYDHLNALWSWRTENEGIQQIVKHEDFKREIAESSRGSDSTSVVVPESVMIWARSSPHHENPQKAFQLSGTAREVRTANGKVVLGLEHCVWGPMPSLPPLEEPRVAEMNLEPNQRIVDPSADPNTAPRGVFTDLTQALNAAAAAAAAKPGDQQIILIKHGKDKKRELEVDVTSLKKSNLDVLLKPFDATYHPILTLANTTVRDAYFFGLLDGKMVFENLEIVLEPDQPNFNSQALVLMDGNASCTFRNCVITLKQNDKFNAKAVPLSVISLSDAEQMMAMMPATKNNRAAAEAIFENCFIRGEGELVTNRAGRPLDLQLANTLAGLTGSLVSVTGGGKEVTAETQVSLKFTRSSILTTEPMLVCKQGKNPRGLPPVRVERSAGCLFAGLEDKPLVVTDYPDLNLANLSDSFSWKRQMGDPGDAFVNLDKMLQNASGFQLDKDGWKQAFYADGDARFARAAFTLGMPAGQFWVALPDDFKAKADAQSDLPRYGATLDPQQLPPLERTPKTE